MIRHRSIEVDGVDLFLREAGPPDAPVLLLLHGFPASSYQYRGLMRELSQDIRCIAPDLPGFGYTEVPSNFDWTFDRVSEVIDGLIRELGLERYSLYLFDWGAPVGLRLAARHPEQIRSLIIQNGNAYKEGLSDRMLGLKGYWADRQGFEPRLRAILTPAALRTQYTEGARAPEAIEPDASILDRRFLDQPGREAAILDLFYDYQHNVEHYERWHRFFREHQPPTLILWGQNDPYFTVAGARAYLRDLHQAELHCFDTGHFALQEDGDAIAARVRDFLTVEREQPVTVG